MLGMLLDFLGRSEEALPFLESALGLPKDSRDYLIAATTLAGAYITLKRNADCIRVCQEAVKHHANDSGLHFKLAACQWTTGYLGLAAVNFETVLRLDPNNSGAANALKAVKANPKYASQLSAIGKFAEAKEDWSSAKSGIAFSRGDVIELIQMDATPWWFGIVNGKFGAVPADKIKLLAQAPTTPAAAPTTPPVAKPVQVTQLPAAVVAVQPPAPVAAVAAKLETLSVAAAPYKPVETKGLPLLLRKNLRDNEAKRDANLARIAAATGTEPWLFEVDMIALHAAVGDDYKSRLGEILYDSYLDSVANRLESLSKDDLVKECLVEKLSTRRVVYRFGECDSYIKTTIEAGCLVIVQTPGNFYSAVGDLGEDLAAQL